MASSGKADATATSADSLALQRVDRQGAEAARAGGGQASIDYQDATELTQDWTALTGWQNTAVQVSGNKLFAVGTANPNGALKSFAVGATERARFQTLMYFKAGGGSPQATYFGIDCGAADHALAASSPDGIFIGWNSSGTRGRFLGANVSGIAQLDVDADGGEPAVDTTFLASIDIDESYVSFTLTALGSTYNTFSYKVARSAIAGLGKSINNVAVFIQDARGAAGHAFAPVIAFKSLQPSRTKTLAAQTIEGATPRQMVTRSSGGDPRRIALPVGYDARKPSPLVMVCHQSLSGAEYTPWSEARFQPVTAALLAAGYIVAADKDTGDLWGNATSLGGRLAFYQYLRDHFNIGPLFLLGPSMGFLAVLNLLTHRAMPTPLAVAGISGVVDLDLLYANPTYTASIKTAYGVAGDGSDYATRTAGYNPKTRSGEEFRGVPVRYYAGSADTTAVPANHGGVLIPLVAPYTNDATVVTVNGVGHLDATLYQGADLVTFFDSHRTSV